MSIFCFYDWIMMISNENIIFSRKYLSIRWLNIQFSCFSSKYSNFVGKTVLGKRVLKKVPGDPRTRRVRRPGLGRPEPQRTRCVSGVELNSKGSPELRTQRDPQGTLHWKGKISHTRFSRFVEFYVENSYRAMQKQNDFIQVRIGGNVDNFVKEIEKTIGNKEIIANQ